MRHESELTQRKYSLIIVSKILPSIKQGNGLGRNLSLIVPIKEACCPITTDKKR